MWTITDKQMGMISNSLREQFEKRVYYSLSKSEYVKKFTINDIKLNITNQTNRIIQYEITNEEFAFQFIQLSFNYKILRLEKLPLPIHSILSSNDSIENIKINLFNYLKVSNYE